MNNVSEGISMLQTLLLSDILKTNRFVLRRGEITLYSNYDTARKLGWE